MGHEFGEQLEVFTNVMIAGILKQILDILQKKGVQLHDVLAIHAFQFGMIAFDDPFDNGGLLRSRVFGEQFGEVLVGLGHLDGKWYAGVHRGSGDLG